MTFSNVVRSKAARLSLLTLMAALLVTQAAADYSLTCADGASATWSGQCNTCMGQCNYVKPPIDLPGLDGYWVATVYCTDCQ